MFILQPKPFEELLSDPALLRKVKVSLTATITASFNGDGAMRGGAVPRTEVQRRFAICEKWFRTLRADKQWSVDRTLDALPYALRAELRGEAYEPDSRSLWTPHLPKAS